VRVVDANVALVRLAGADDTEALIAQAKHDYATGRLDLDALDERVGAILDGTWPPPPPPPEPCDCEEPDGVEVTRFGEAARRYLCNTCGRMVPSDV
jgi:hypothetical protein